MTTAVIVAAHAHDDGHRVAARRWVTDRYLALYPWPVHVSIQHAAYWCKAEAVNPTVADIDADVLVIADADSYTSVAGMSAAVAAVQHGRADWALPASSVYRLDQRSTAHVLATDPDTDQPADTFTGRSHELLPGGGIVVVRADLWRDVGGFDPRFVGWGGEDFALGCALRALSGQYAHKVGGTLWHLWHPPAPSNGGLLPDDNFALANRYRAAKFDPAAMRDIINERQAAWH